MRLQILSENQLRSAGLGPRFNLLQLKPGDMLPARIIGSTPDGRTLLQFHQFRAVSDQPLPGAVGTRIDFEVLSRTGTQDGRELQARLAVLSQEPRTVRITSLLALREASADARQSTPAPAARAPDSPAGDRHKTPATDNALATEGHNADNSEAAAVPATDTIRRWLRRLQLQLHRSTPQGKIENAGEDQTRDRSGRLAPESERASRPGSDRSAELAPRSERQDFWFQGMDGTRRPIQMRLRQQAAGKRSGMNSVMVSAAFMLEFESLGAVHIDLRMTAERLWVDFGVAAETVRQAVLAHLEEIDGPLRALAAGGVCCRIRVAGENNAAIGVAEDPEATGIDLEV
jgi:hypothetical protein